MDKQKVQIYVLVAIMLFSVIGLTFTLIWQSDPSSLQNTNSELAELQQQLEAQQAAQDAAMSAAAACAPMQSTGLATPLPPPEEPFIPDEDVIEIEKTTLREGDGETVEPGACIVAHYHGTLAIDGTVFDSSYERGEPARFSLQQVIAGWQEGVPGMKVGEVRRLVIPSELAYGAQGNPPVIGPNADLVFIIELVAIEEAES